AMVARQVDAVHPIGEQHFLSARLFDGKAPRKRNAAWSPIGIGKLRDLAGIGSFKDHFDGILADTGTLEHRRQRNASPFRIADAAQFPQDTGGPRRDKYSAIAGTFEERDLAP